MQPYLLWICLIQQAALLYYLPPGTSKWNKIELRVFSFISPNWRGVPLRS